MRRFLIAFALIGTAAFAHQGATGIVKERMDAMSELGKSMKALAGAIKASDAAEIKTLAQAIEKHGGQSMLEQFPNGSLSKVSEATPAVWQDWEGFSKLAFQLEAQAQSLAANPGKAEAIFAQLGNTCKACHKDYRIKKK